MSDFNDIFVQHGSSAVLSIVNDKASVTNDDDLLNPPKKPRKKKAVSDDKKPCALLELLQRYIFLKNHNRIYNRVTRNELTREGFDGAYLHFSFEDNASVVFLSDPEAIKVDGLIYLPGEQNNPVHRAGAILWNIWRDPEVILPAEASKHDVEPWLGRLKYLYPNKEERDHLINWFAFILRFPGVKINHALLVAGTSRVGKDLLLMPLRYGLGSANVCKPPAGELKESFTDYLHHSKLVICQEIQTFEGL